MGDVQQVRGWLREARRIAVLTGAGMSAESGVPTFRDAQAGLWSNFRPEELATEDAFRARPQFVWDWYAMRREQLRHVGGSGATRWETKRHVLLSAAACARFQRIDVARSFVGLSGRRSRKKTEGH